jgi:asparagine N-glycosylation enzyme membrane subunit Stt3
MIKAIIELISVTLFSSILVFWWGYNPYPDFVLIFISVYLTIMILRELGEIYETI